MASFRSSELALFLTINLLFFNLSSGWYTCSEPKPIRTPVTHSKKSCPRDTLKLGVCTKLLNGPVVAVVGLPFDHPCCSVLEGLVDLEAAVCLCIAIKANILGININIPISLSLLVNTCGKSMPSDFLCA